MRWGVLAVVLLLALTNPSIKALKEHLGLNDIRIEREYNFLLCSVYRMPYEVPNGNEGHHTEYHKYLGILSNFIQIE
ncbi:MAG: hypothetical protein JSU01_06340 [Bacteroidetes bacterium]|nr:hypothetical protein [Bacteroidota bacterium]